MVLLRPYQETLKVLATRLVEKETVTGRELRALLQNNALAS